MNRLALSIFLLLPVGLAAGCSGYRSETFNIVIHNATDRPLTLSLAKNGPPYEPAWATPEDAAIDTPKFKEEWVGGETGTGQVIPPGKTASVLNLKGQFGGSTQGFVRIYAGDLKISEMIARSRGSSERLDVRLKPGDNKMVVRIKDYVIVAEPTP